MSSKMNVLDSIICKLVTNRSMTKNLNLQNNSILQYYWHLETRNEKRDLTSWFAFIDADVQIYVLVVWVVYVGHYSTQPVCYRNATGIRAAHCDWTTWNNYSTYLLCTVQYRVCRAWAVVWPGTEMALGSWPTMFHSCQWYEPSWWWHAQNRVKPSLQAVAKRYGAKHAG